MLKFDRLSSTEGGIKRDKLLDYLAEKGIATRQGTHSPHTLECYKKLCKIDAEDIPNAYACDRLSITLPLYVQMTDEEQDYVVEQLKKAYSFI